MNMLIFIIISISCQTVNSLKNRVFHQLTVQSSHQNIVTIDFWQFQNTVMLIIIIAVIAGGCWYLRGCFDTGSRQQTHVLVVSQDNNRSVVVRNNQEKRYPVQNKQPPPSNQKNEIASYFKGYQIEKSQQKRIIPQQTNNPYVTQKQYNQRYEQWQKGSTYTRSQNISKCCGICNQLVKDGQRPRVVVNCAQQDVFHLKCLSQLRQRIILSLQGNGLYKCPTCKDVYSPSIQIYCKQCRNMKVVVALPQVSNDSGQIKMDQLKTKYGDLCQECRTF